jgi:hypothetical protein
MFPPGRERLAPPRDRINAHDHDDRDRRCRVSRGLDGLNAGSETPAVHHGDGQTETPLEGTCSRPASALEGGSDAGVLRAGGTPRRERQQWPLNRR